MIDEKKEKIGHPGHRKQFIWTSPNLSTLLRLSQTQTSEKHQEKVTGAQPFVGNMLLAGKKKVPFFCVKPGTEFFMNRAYARRERSREMNI